MRIVANSFLAPVTNNEKFPFVAFDDNIALKGTSLVSSVDGILHGIIDISAIDVKA